MSKQFRYKKLDGSDLIDRWAREEAPIIFRAKMLAHMEAYIARYGLKDEPLSEITKIIDFANRLKEYELKLNSNKTNKWKHV